LSETTADHIDNLLHLAQVAKSSQRYNEALKYYQKVIEVDGQNFDAWFNMAEIHAQVQGEFGPEVSAMAYALTKALEGLTINEKKRLADRIDNFLFDACREAWGVWIRLLRSGILWNIDFRRKDALVKRYYEFSKGLDQAIDVSRIVKPETVLYVELGHKLFQHGMQYLVNSEICDDPDIKDYIVKKTKQYDKTWHELEPLRKKWEQDIMQREGQ
jgi:tetratricopeptide (TPR) repeat protein